TASHELLEAVTDPLRNVGPASSEAWNTRTSTDGGEELADLCVTQSNTPLLGQVAGFTVEKAWSDLQDACVVKNPCQSCSAGTSCFCGDFICRPRTSMCP